MLDETSPNRKRRLAAERQRRRRAKLREQGLSSRGKPLEKNTEVLPATNGVFPCSEDLEELAAALKRYYTNPSDLTVEVCKDLAIVLSEKIQSIQAPRELSEFNGRDGLTEAEAANSYGDMQAVVLSCDHMSVAYHRLSALTWSEVLHDFAERSDNSRNDQAVSFYLWEAGLGTV